MAEATSETRTPDRQRETLKERFQRGIQEVKDGRGTRAQEPVRDAWQEKSIAAARAAGDRETARQEPTRYDRQMEIREAQSTGYKREFERAAREDHADRASTHQQREMAYHTQERPDRQRETLKEQFQRQIRERPQERDTGRGR